MTRSIYLSPMSGESPCSSLQPPSLHDRLAQVSSEDSTLHAWAHLPNSVEPGAPAPAAPRALEGMPFGVKDVLDVLGMPTRCGSDHVDDTPAARDAGCVALLREAGAVPLGKTHTAEFAYRRPPLTRNPVAPGHTPGGSSSGSAAAVAAQMVPFALSTQTGGSIIRPAAYCGTVGFKPSFGAVARSGLGPGCESLDTIGWHAADLNTAHRVACVLLDNEPRFQTVKPRSVEGLRVLHISAPGEELPEAEVADNLGRACEALGARGAVLLRQRPQHSSRLDRLLAAHKIVMHYELSRSLRPIVLRHPAVSAPVQQLLQTGRSISRSDYTEALAFQARERLSWEAFTEGADIILSPSAPTAAGVGLENSGSSAYCRAWTFLGWPCLHVPIGNTGAGLPLGFQIITPWQRDFDAFEAAEAIYRVCGGKDTRPLSDNDHD